MDSLNLDDKSAEEHVAKKGKGVAGCGIMPEISPGRGIALPG